MVKTDLLYWKHRWNYGLNFEESEGLKYVLKFSWVPQFFPLGGQLVGKLSELKWDWSFLKDNHLYASYWFENDIAGPIFCLQYFEFDLIQSYWCIELVNLENASLAAFESMYAVLPITFPLGDQGLLRDHFLRFGLLFCKSQAFECKASFIA